MWKKKGNIVDSSSQKIPPHLTAVVTLTVSLDFKLERFNGSYAAALPKTNVTGREG